MAIQLLHEPAARHDLPAGTPLRAAAAHDNEAVHLIPLVAGIPAQQSLCGAPVTAHPPRRLLTNSGCRICTEMAVALGSHFAEDRHGAFVNLQRAKR